MNISEFKNAAKAEIKGTGVYFAVYFLVFALIFGVSFIINKFVCILITLFLLLPVYSLSFSKICIGIAEGKKPCFKDIKSGFFRYARNLITVILIIGYTVGWASVLILPKWFIEYFPYWLNFGSVYETLIGSILLKTLVFLSVVFMICGMIWALTSYVMTFFVLSENIYVNSDEAIKRSKEIMKGNKKDFLSFFCSFIPLFLLIPLTFGVASFFVLPYYRTALAHYYHSIKRHITDAQYIIERF